MNNTIYLKDLFVGCADGKTEAEMQDRDFTDLFYTGNSKVKECENPIKFIISGRKGTGKTILAMYLNDYFKKQYSQLNSRYVYMPDSIKLEEFIERQFKNIEQDEYNLFSLYYIYKIISDMIIESNIKYKEFITSKNKRNSIKTLIEYHQYQKSKSFLKKWFSSRYNQGEFFRNSFEEANSSSLSSSLGVKYNGVSASVGGEETSTKKAQYRIAHFTSELQRIKREIFVCLKVQPIFVIFDDIDDIKIYIKEEKGLKQFLIGFIKAISTVNKEISKFGMPNKCIAIVRDDILQNLNSFDSNLNKILSDSEINIDWIGNNDEQALLEMIINKMTKSMPVFEGRTYDEVCKIVFFREPKAKSIFKLILKRSFGRPRDIIRYLNIIIEQNGNSSVIIDDYVRQAYPQYSTYFWNELKNELSFFYDDDYIEAIERLLSSNGKKNFTYEGIKIFFESHKNDYASITNFDEFMETLYRFGIIGSFRRGNGQSEKASFYYRKGSKRKLEKNDMIAVHFGLRPVFNL